MDDEYAAIVESTEMPIYFFTYQIDYVQFVYSDPFTNPNDPIDHSVAARNHAQFITNKMNREAHYNKNGFKDSETLNSLLIRSNYEIIQVEYTSILGKSSMPKGLEK